MYLDVTVEVYTLSLKERTKLKGLLEVVSSSADFEAISIRRQRTRYSVAFMIVYLSNWIVPTSKPLISRRSCCSSPIYLVFNFHPTSQILVLEKVLDLLSACVDVMSSNAWLNALGAMDLSQMCVQGNVGNRFSVEADPSLRT